MSLSKFLLLCLIFPVFSRAQVGGSWTTFSGDLQRTGWNKAEFDLTPENVKDLKLEWKLKLDSAPLGLNNLTAPIVRTYQPTPTGVKELVIVGGATDKLFVIDADTGKLYWQKTLESQATPQRSETWLCPNALNATPVIGPFPGKGQAVYALASDGRVHAFNLVSGEDVMPPTQFVPPFAKVWSLTVAANTLYTTTSQGNCNGMKAGVFAMDLNDPGHKVTVFQSAQSGAGIWGRASAAFTADGKLIVETGDGPYDPNKGNYSDSVLALSPKDLKVVDYFTPNNRSWITKKDLDMGSISPVVFPFKDRELAAAAGKEGVIFLLDTKSLGGADHRTPLFRSPLYTNEEVNFIGKGFWGAFSTWEDAAGTRWLYAPALGPVTANAKSPQQYGDTPHGSVMAFKVELQGDKPVLTPAWNSVDMSVPTPVVIANGMVFAIADGDATVQFGPNGNLLSTADRKARTTNAVFYVLNAATGKVLFSSGDTIQGFSHFSAPAVAGGRAYAVTYDGTVYCFGLGIPQP